MASLELGQGPFLAESWGRRVPEAVRLMQAVGRRVQPLRPHHLHQSHLGSVFSSDYLFTRSRGILLLWVYMGYKKSISNMNLNVTLCFLFKYTSSLLHVFLWNTLHSIDLQFYVSPSRYCIRDTINSFFVNLQLTNKKFIQ